MLVVLLNDDHSHHFDNHHSIGPDLDHDLVGNIDHFDHFDHHFDHFDHFGHCFDHSDHHSDPYLAHPHLPSHPHQHDHYFEYFGPIFLPTVAHDAVVSISPFGQPSSQPPFPSLPRNSIGSDHVQKRLVFHWRG